MRTKYLLDKLIALFGLLVLSPILAIIALLIKVRMPGGGDIFKQTRIGQGGEGFTMYKFRSMVPV
ncbi:MAG: sugar transferase, partial [Bacteroidales bacterium]|nr:sugar transferase [Bacteroidales bacterium]